MEQLARGQDIRRMDEAARNDCHISILQLMEYAALAVYEEIVHRIEKGTRILIICGKGCNGGDGFTLARLLEELYQVQIFCPYEKQELVPEALKERESCEALHMTISHKLDELKEAACACDVIVDGLFGTGLQRDIAGVEQTCIEIINASAAYVISIDLPSGIHCDSGRCMHAAVNADLSVAFSYAKRGMYLYPGYQYCGEIIVKDIHLPRCIREVKQPVYLLDEEGVAEMLPKRRKHSHKGTYGKALLIGGSESMHGAVEMAAAGCLYSGIGTLTCMIPDVIRSMLGAKISEAMLLCEPSSEGYLNMEAVSDLKQFIADYDVIGIGCGIGRTKAAFALLKAVLNSNRPCVIDADALYMLKDHIELLHRDAPVILTPHPKEMSYLCKKQLDDILLHPLEAAQTFVKEFPHVVLVLKEEHTLIVHQDQMFLNARGNHGLAKGGSGDVLCGTILGLLGQSASALHSACSGVFIHACAAEQLMRSSSGYSMQPSQLPKAYADVFRRLAEK